VIARARRRRTSLPRRALRNLRAGRAQQMLSAATAASALPLGIEVFVSHYGGSFANRWMWSPVALLPSLGAAGAAAVVSERAARTWLPALAALTAADGAFGVVMHGRGIARKPGGFHEATYNLVQGPPLLAPGSLAMTGAIGLLAAAMRRERW
jgi:hypothetical protein